MDKSTEDLLRSLKATAGARFNAAKRVSFVDSRLTALTAIASTCVIALTIFPNFFEIHNNAKNLVALTTVALSVLLLVFSLLQYSCNYAVKAELFHRSALEIQELKRELQYKANNIDEQTFTRISKRYNDILNRYSLNHDDVDFYRQQLENWSEFPMTGWERFRKWRKVTFAYFYPSFLLGVIAVVTFLTAIGASMWPRP